MKRYIGLLLVFVVIISYQNCATKHQDNYTTSDREKFLDSISYNKIAVNQFRNLIIAMSDTDFSNYLDLDIENGKMTEFKNFGQVQCPSLQLDEANLLKMQTILYDAQICQPIISPEMAEQLNKYYKETLCTMSYTYAYATLKDATGEEVKLGEKSNGCEQPTDLCGQKPQELKLTIQDIISQYRDLLESNCH